MTSTSAQVTFWTPLHRPASPFGCASHGLASTALWVGPESAESATWSPGVPACRFAGDRATVLSAIDLVRPRATAVIVFGARAVGLEQVVSDLAKRFSDIPTIGGGAARCTCPNSPGDCASVGETMPAAEFAVLVLTQGLWRADTLCVHDDLGSVECRLAGPRTISELKLPGDAAFRPAREAFDLLRSRHGVEPADAETLTLGDATGVNRHFHPEGSAIVAGADLPESPKLTIRYAPVRRIRERLDAFCSAENSLICGCAGLRSLLDQRPPVGKGTLLGFLFGEVCTTSVGTSLGNLMFSRLVPA